MGEAAQRTRSPGHGHRAISQPSAAAVCSLEASGKTRGLSGDWQRRVFDSRTSRALYWIFAVRLQSKLHIETSCETGKPLHEQCALQHARHTPPNRHLFQSLSSCGTMLIQAQQSNVKFFIVNYQTSRHFPVQTLFNVVHTGFKVENWFQDASTHRPSLWRCFYLYCVLKSNKSQHCRINLANIMAFRGGGGGYLLAS